MVREASDGGALGGVKVDGIALEISLKKGGVKFCIVKKILGKG